MLVKVEFIYHMLVYFRIKYNVQQSKIKCARAQRSEYFIVIIKLIISIYIYKSYIKCEFFIHKKN